MGSFDWMVDGEPVRIIFSLIRNGRWLDDRRDVVVFDYLDHEFVTVISHDLDVENDEYDRDLWDMLLQVTNLAAT